MRKRDPFLIGILIFIAVLVVAALVLFFVRKTSLTYGTEDTPAGVVRNYAVALQLGDYKRAYGYLAEGAKRISYADFSNAFLSGRLDVADVTLQVGETTWLGDDRADVAVTITHVATDPFADEWSSIDHVTLARQDGDWKITTMFYPLWDWNWIVR